MNDETPLSPAPAPHVRRKRYAGKHPRQFDEKYKEHNPERYSDTVAKVVASGKTPAGTHRPIMVNEALELLAPQPGDIAVDCTLGYGGHAEQLLHRLSPDGRLIGLDADPVELPKTQERLLNLGFDEKSFTAVRSNFAGLAQILGKLGIAGADIILADLGVSSMQLDDPSRGFSVKYQGPLDMRMNPQRGQSAGAWLERATPTALTEILRNNADEPRAVEIANVIAGKPYRTTAELARAIRSTLPRINDEAREMSVRRVFQALRIVVNDEFSALETFLRFLPSCLNPGGRVAIITFHSGEDRRVKHAFTDGLRAGNYAEIAQDIIRPSSEERRSNPRSIPAKLRWARRS